MCLCVCVCVCVCVCYFSIIFLHIAGDQWSAPDGWNTEHPQSNLHLDIDQAPYIKHNGASHVTTQVSQDTDIQSVIQTVSLPLKHCA